MPLHSGLACILGAPNAGKSTLLNALVGQKLAIISPKPQTTRNRILGVVNVPRSKNKPYGQVILVDTPGVHKSISSLGRKMMTEVRQGLEGSDIVLFIVDASKPRSSENDFVLDLVKKTTTPAFLLLNKIDLIKNKQDLLPLITQASQWHNFAETIPLSARTGEGLDLLLTKLLQHLPQGPRYFPEDQVTDQPVRFMVAEIVREQILFNTGEEVPHSTTVLIEQFEEGKKLTRIAAAIYCEREGQKRILIGKQGSMLKKIGTAARLQIEEMVGTKVFLELFVKVKADWRQSQQFVEELDWRGEFEKMSSIRKVTP
ncbi:MAG: GTPase Era [Acidobacteriales bacterium]|nr:GTPase Era [Terriglobales bacterium]